MKALVIGGNGFIGSHVVDRLLREGHKVRVFDRQQDQFRDPLPGVEYHFGNFSNRMALLEAMIGVDVIFHLVSTTFPGTADFDPRTDVQENLVDTLNLLDAMQSISLSRILFLSSGGTVYGVPNQVPIPESHPLQPIGSYGIVKTAIESYLSMYHRAGKLSPVIIRASNPYGPRQSHSGVQGVISTFMRNIHAGDQIEIWGDGSVVRDYLDVTDLAALCVKAAGSDKVGAYNAGSGVGTSITEIVDLLRAVTGRDIQPMYKPGRSLDVPQSILDTSRAHHAFNWHCQTELQPGLRRMWEWLQNDKTRQRFGADRTM